MQRKTRLAIEASVLVTVLAAGYLFWNSAQPVDDTLNPDSLLVQNIMDKASSSYVNVYCDVNTEESFEGSGVAIRNDGKDTLIITSMHLINPCIEEGSIEVVYSLPIVGEDTQVIIEGIDSKNDLALLRITNYLIEPATIGGVPKVGDNLIAIGNNFGQDIAVSVGKFLGYRSKNYMTSVETERGGSGGPLVNIEGELIGIVNKKYYERDYKSLATNISLICETLIDDCDFAREESFEPQL